MAFDALLDQVIALLQRRGRLTYRALKRQFNLDDDYLEDLKAELIQGQRLAVDEEGTVLVWKGDTVSVVASTSAPAPVQAQAPLTYTPEHLVEKILVSRAVLEGERKQVTVLFADLKSSTELIEGLDPEEARKLLDPALHIMMDAVHRYEGTVNQTMGDGIMALFGAPVAHEDHAVRACYAALAMQAAMRRYAEEVRHSHGLEVLMRVGLNSGEVVVRAIGNDLHMDYSAVGQTTNLAARMETLATPGSSRLTAATFKLAEGLVQVNALGRFPVKGLTEPVEVFELVGASTIRRRLQASAARGLTRFVGRQQELAALQQALERAGIGHGQVVAVVGEAGVGKSRLVYEFVHAHHTSGWLVLESASVSYGKATPYFPVIDLLKRYSHVEEHDDARTMRAKVTGQVLTLDLALQDTVPALLALLEVLPEDSPFLQLDPPQRRQRTLDALKQVLMRESQVQPLLLVFEDLHWIDTETQALLDHLVESIPTARLLLLVNYRPEYQHGWSNKTFYTQLRLDPLPPASADALLQALLGDAPSLAPLQQLLIARTEGNPFFLEEGVRTLLETGVLVGERGAYHLAHALPTIQVPATVQAMLAARIDRLSSEEKRLLQTAAVIGTDVPFALLRAIADTPEVALHRGLAHLQAAEFLYETRLFPEPDYTFKHALTHEVAYSSLLLERRRVLHAQIVEALEILAGDRQDEQIDRLAQHAVRGQVWDKALQYCRQAGDKALAGSAYQEAVGYLEQALEALSHLPPDRPMLEQAVDLRRTLSVALEVLGQWAQGLTHLHEAETLAEGLADHRRLGHVCHRIASTLTFMQDYEPALAYCQRAHAIATALGDVDLQVWVNGDMGEIYASLGDYRQAIAYLQQVLTALPGEQRSQSFSGIVLLRSITARVHMVQCLRELGRFADGMAQSDEALQVAEAGARTDDRLAVYGGMGYLHVRQGTLHQAIPLLERAVALSQDANIPVFYYTSAPFLALAYALAGRATDALAVLGQVEGNMGVPPLSLTCGEAYLHAGRVEEAHRLAQRGLAHARHHKMRGSEARALWLLGEIAMHHDPLDVSQTEAYYQQSLALAEELGMRPLQAHCHLGLGTLYTKTGQRAQARVDLSTAIDLYRAMEMLFWLPQAEVALAQVDGQ
jgi:class 3 adenylate cyclase/tetratricopeptide (TPR) repeat protein